MEPSDDQRGRTKLYAKKARKQGLHAMLGGVSHDQLILIVEGFATGATLHDVLRLPVAVAFASGNLLPVGLALRSQYYLPWRRKEDEDAQAPSQYGLSYQMTPDEYRARWELPDSYPLVAPNYPVKRLGISGEAMRPQTPTTTPPESSHPKAPPLLPAP